MEIKQVLAEKNFRFNKNYGQNFISDTNLLKAIVCDSNITDQDVVVEIGPGAGTLTREIATKAKKVIAFEIDRNLKSVLETTLDGIANVEVIFQDILKTDMKEIEKLAGGRFKVVANLPYYITTPILMKFLEETDQADSLTFMVQKEVADRLTAKADTSDYGGITAVVDFLADVKIARKVSREMFFPQPNVDSAVVFFKIVQQKYKCHFRELFFKVVRSAFLMRRKTLQNNLVSYFKISREEAISAIESIGFDANVRGEVLNTQDFVKLTNILGA